MISNPSYLPISPIDIGCGDVTQSKIFLRMGFSNEVLPHRTSIIRRYDPASRMGYYVEVTTMEGHKLSWVTVD